MIDDAILRDRARECLKAGTFPARRPDRTWGGPGAGATCAICDTPVTCDELELELEFSSHEGLGVGKHHLHVRCYGAWEAVRHHFRPVTPAIESATPVAEGQGTRNLTSGALAAATDGGVIALSDWVEPGKIARDGSGRTYNRGAA